MGTPMRHPGIEGMYEAVDADQVRLYEARGWEVAPPPEPVDELTGDVLAPEPPQPEPAALPDAVAPQQPPQDDDALAHAGGMHKPEKPTPKKEG
jgi:hypothetical protein